MARRSSPCIRCLAGLLMLNSGLAHAAVSVTEQVELYAVDGKDLSAVIAEMNRIGPQSDDGQRRWGITRYRLGWQFRHRRGESGCRAEPLTVELNLETVLPSWRQRDKATPDQQANWAVLSRALAAHEEGHARIARQCANTLQQTLDKRAQAPDCEQLRQQLSKAGEASLDACDARHADYDLRTRNGYLQGLNIQ